VLPSGVLFDDGDDDDDDNDYWSVSGVAGVYTGTR